MVVKGRFVMTKLQIRKTDSDGNEDLFKRNFKKGDDLAKIAKDDRLKGFKIVDINEAGEHSEITFADKGILRVGERLSDKNKSIVLAYCRPRFFL